MYVNISGVLIMTFLSFYAMFFLILFFTTCYRACFDKSKTKKQPEIEFLNDGYNDSEVEANMSWLIIPEEFDTLKSQEVV